MKIVGNILASLFAIFYFFVLLAMMILIFMSNAFSANYYKNILNNIDLASIKLSDFGIVIDEFDANATVEDILVKALEEAGISKNDALNILNNEQINETVGTLLSDTMNYIVGNEEMPKIEYQDVLNIMNTEEISGVIEDKPSEEEIKEMVNELNDYIKENLRGEFNYE